MIELNVGSIFDSKCDLLVIPCNNAGEIEQSIEKELIAKELPCINSHIMVGDVQFFQNYGSFSNAPIVGYAAAVDRKKDKSSEDIVRDICNKIAKYCGEHYIYKINIPLLGAASDKLLAEDSFKVMKEVFGEDDTTIFCIYTESEVIYKRLTEIDQLSHEKRLKHPRVFISYTGKDAANKEWVIHFAEKLRENGVNARLDVFHLKPGMDLPQFMTDEVIKADKVLLICDKYYAQKADSRNGGVGWETMIIQGDMLSQQNSRKGNEKYVAIIRDKDINQSLPIYVKSKYALDWGESEPDVEKLEKLILYLYGCDDEPPLGKIPDFVRKKFSERMDVSEKET